jgi:hypothetical protein
MSKLPAITTFGPEVMATLIEGSRREIVVELPYRDAIVLRQRMHQLRARMREDKHELASIVSAAKVTIRWGVEVATSKSRKGIKYPTDNDSLVELIVRPQDSTFRTALEKAGIKVDIPEPATPTLAPDESPEDILEIFLRREKEKK